MKKIAILQPNYIPWKGVFDLISQVDVFVFYDDVQYTVKDWRNRNIIKTMNGDLMLTVPVKTKGLREQLVCDAMINNSLNWQKKHYKTIKYNYQKAMYFQEYEYLLEEIYLNHKWNNISELDIFVTKLLAKVLNIEVEWYKSSDLQKIGSKNGEKVIKICKDLGCNYFINGPSAKGFMDESLFRKDNIVIDYINYNYPEYKQMYEPFNHYVSVLDVIFNCGPEANKMVCTGKERKICNG